ncbi:putative non-specific serine/threonine protein kinase [Helianthus annuus]|nr:putative non-specific serine/threonine protein kinase [Helianthus annuus]
MMVTDLRGCRLSELRRRALQRRAAEAKVSSEEEEQLLRNLEKKETEYMRLQRHKIGIDDFELLTLISKECVSETEL